MQRPLYIGTLYIRHPLIGGCLFLSLLRLILSVYRKWFVKKDDIAVLARLLCHVLASFPLMSCKTSFPNVMGRTSRGRTFALPTSRLGPREDKGPSSGRHLSLLFYGHRHPKRNLWALKYSCLKCVWKSIIYIFGSSVFMLCFLSATFAMYEKELPVLIYVAKMTIRRQFLKSNYPLFVLTS